MRKKDWADCDRLWINHLLWKPKPMAQVLMHIHSIQNMQTKYLRKGSNDATKQPAPSLLQGAVTAQSLT